MEDEFSNGLDIAEVIAATDAAEKAHDNSKKNTSSHNPASELTLLKKRLIESQNKLTKHRATLEVSRRQRRLVLLPQKWDELDKLLDQKFLKGTFTYVFAVICELCVCCNLCVVHSHVYCMCIYNRFLHIHEHIYYIS